MRGYLGYDDDPISIHYSSLDSWHRPVNEDDYTRDPGIVHVKDGVAITAIGAELLQQKRKDA